MKKRIISLFLFSSILLSILSGCNTSSNNINNDQFITNGNMLVLICETFGMYEYFEETPYISSVDTSNPYFAVVQACVEWDIIDPAQQQDYDVHAPATYGVLAISAVNAAELSTPNMTDEEKISLAAEYNIVESQNGKFDENKFVNYDEALISIQKAQTLWAEKKYEIAIEEVSYLDGVKNYSDGASAVSDYSVDGNQVIIPVSSNIDINPGDTYVLAPNDSQSVAYAAIAETIEEIDGYYVITNSNVELELDDLVSTLYEESTYTPNLLTDCIFYDADGNPVQLSTDTSADGVVFDTSVEHSFYDNSPPRADYTAQQLAYNSSIVQQLGIFKSGKFSFTTKDGYEISVSISEDTYTVGVKIPINDYFKYEGSVSFSDLEVTHDVDYSFGKLNSATLKIDYKTEITNGINVKAKIPSLGLVPYNNRNGGFLSNLKASRLHFLGEERKGATSIKIGSIELVGSKICGVRLNVQLKFNLDGTVSLSITQAGSKGIQYKNNTLRYIKTDSSDWDINVKGKLEMTPSLGVELHFWKVNLLSIAVDGGVGATIELIFHVVDGENHLIEEGQGDIPGDMEEAIVQSTIQTTKSVIAEAAEAQGGKYIYTDDAPVDLHCDVCFDVNLYWILRIGIEDECLVGKLAKNKFKLSLEILNAKNATFAEWHLEDWNNVKECTREYTPFDMDNLDETIQEDMEAAENKGTSSETLDINAYVISLPVGSDISLQLTSIPDGYEEDQLVWTSEDTSIATVDTHGNIHGVSAGDTTISVSLNDNPNMVVKCTVFVTAVSENSGDFLAATFTGGTSDVVIL